jgi:hypothetical protein
VGLVGLGALAAWVYWPGCVSHANYERIQVGMSRELVAKLLGSPGEETECIPGYPPYVHLPGAPPGWTGIVWGDTFVHWQDGSQEIYVGFIQGRVASKDYSWELLPWQEPVALT